MTDVKAALLKCGKEEFLTKGFEKASLRSICRNAGVTTGAFYSYFRKKEDLFTALVKKTVTEFKRLYGPIHDSSRRGTAPVGGNENSALEFIMARRDEFRLLFDCSQGTKYEDFKDNLIDTLFEDAYMQFLEAHSDAPVDPALVKVLVRMKFAEYAELIYGGYDREHVMRLAKLLSGFSEAGMQRVTELLGQ